MKILVNIALDGRGRALAEVIPGLAQEVVASAIAQYNSVPMSSTTVTMPYKGRAGRGSARATVVVRG